MNWGRGLEGEGKEGSEGRVASLASRGEYPWHVC